MDDKSILLAVEEGDMKAIDKYLKDGGDINRTTDIGFTLLRFALSFSNTANDVKDFKYMNDDIILYLIRKGSNINVRHFQGKTLLMVALIGKRSYDIVHELINAGSDVNAVCEQGKTPLICAIYYQNSLKIVMELIDRGANVNYYDSFGTPLLYAVRLNCDSNIVAALISAGANVQRVCRNHSENLLMAISCNGRICNEYTCQKRKQVIAVLLNNGADLKLTDKNGNNIIHNSQCFYLIALGIRNGISIESKNHDGYTPLMSACLYNCYKKKVKYLLSCGANPNLIEFHQIDLHCKYDIISLLVYHRLNLFVERNGKLEGLGFNDLKNFHPPNEAIKSFIKNYLLFFNENEEELNDLLVDSEMKQFKNDCVSEISKMKESFINVDLTFYYFCLLKQFYRSVVIDLSYSFYKSRLLKNVERCIKSVSILHNFYERIVNLSLSNCVYTNSFKDVEIYIKSLFPIFHNIILMRIKDNHIEKCKKRLHHCLSKVNLYPVLSTEVDSDVIIPYDCLYYIGRFLSYEMLYRLFLVSI